MKNATVMKFTNNDSSQDSINGVDKSFDSETETSNFL